MTLSTVEIMTISSTLAVVMMSSMVVTNLPKEMMAVLIQQFSLDHLVITTFLEQQTLTLAMPTIFKINVMDHLMA